MKELEFIKQEEQILNFWQHNQIFEQSVKNREGKPDFVFYEGPPTANGKPGIHHVLARSFKDAICRYKTMRGFRVLRKAGWDTHGLPVELEVEKSLGFRNKNDIEKYGIKEFNQKAKESVWQYKEEWEKLTNRMAYWIDTKNPYITFENNYIETVWWLLKQINERGLLYKSYKVLPYCPRCSTPLSSHEVAQGYETIQDPSIYIKFQILNPKPEILNKFQTPNSKLYLLVWTTTPWTLIANTAIAIDSKLEYQIFKVGDDYLISLKNLPDNQGKKIGLIQGADLIGLHYVPLYELSTDLILSSGKQYEVVGANFINIEEGTGIVHIAPAFGEDDMNLKNELGLSVIKHIDDKGNVMFNISNLEIKGKFFKEIDPIIFNDLKERNLLYQGDLKGVTHEYPFCWRCHTPLLYFAFEAWYIKMSQLKEDLLKNNELINWVPEHIKNGRFGQWLRDIKDWAISRNRYWGTPLNIWECESCNYYEVIGSIKELEEKSINHRLPFNDKQELDLHRPFVDEIQIKCPKCGGAMKRRKEVLDCWFDSGSMPFAQYHFPFDQFKNIEGKRDIKEMIRSIPFPADYISEAVDQTRGWFYTLLAISTLLDLGPSFKNVICLGLILDKKGEKMSKSKGNVVDPLAIMQKYGADTLRWYLYTINSPGEEKRFDENDLIIIQRNIFNILWNTFIFYELYADKTIINENNLKLDFDKLNILDQWILSCLEQLKIKTLNNLDNYYIYEATKEISKFIDDLSHWYIRRARPVFQKKNNELKWQQSSLVLYKVLKELSLLFAPFCPFWAELLWQKLKLKTDPISVHLSDYPGVESRCLNEELLISMGEIREIANLALSLRQKANIKIRQPLRELRIKNCELKDKKELLDILKEEINVKEIVFDKNLTSDIELDTTITPELKEEGIFRELIRQIQEIRKSKNLTPQDKIKIEFFTTDNNLIALVSKYNEELKARTLASDLLGLSAKSLDMDSQILLDDKIIFIKITKQ